jgi:hypothetical protein
MTWALCKKQQQSETSLNETAACSRAAPKPSREELMRRSHGICGQQTISAASRPLNILHMGLMSAAAEWCWLLMAHVSQAMPIFGRGLRLKIWHSAANLDHKPWHFWSTNHISCLQTLEYPPYGSDECCCRVVLAPDGPFEPGHANFWKWRGQAESLSLSSKSGPQAMAFVVNKPYQLPPDP